MKKPIYKRVWFWVIAVIIVFGAISASGSKEETTPVANSNNTNNINTTQDKSDDTGNETTEKEGKEVEEKVENEVEKVVKEDSVPREYKSALKKAVIYAETMNMSKAGIYNQLTSEYGENFPPEAAQYAIDNIEFDWKEAALKKAKTYAETMNMSNSAVYDQLISEYGEKFTKEEAQYAIDNLE
ncbi:Ltp family lipoprotein [Paenibacillus sp. An7]|uniref:Ltp family lipoprotein n=1 Tax=Paenibacillus sp. An7 TaxID=2689577 RepID=UPI001F2F8B66|nr:Ltp family lipoprotein [Paenibacillus sp. An7]